MSAAVKKIRGAAAALLKRPPTLVAAAFAAIGGGIVANALLQAGPHPAPFFFTRAWEPGASDSIDLVRSIQDSLMQIGYYSGPLDGIAGPQTQAAIRAFQEQAGDAATGEPSRGLLSEIRSASRPDLSPVKAEVESAPASADGGEGTHAAQAAPDGFVAAVQDALARSAYGPLTVDGVAGPATRDAIVRFQSDHNLPVTGAVDDALVMELRAVGALGSQ